MANNKQVSSKFFPLVFHVILWTIWIGLPIINAGDNQKFLQYSLWSIPIALTNIPLFLLNTEFLIPTLFKKKGISTYLVSLILLVIGYSILQYLMKDWIIPNEFRIGRGGRIFWTVIPILFVTAISTGYGFISYLTKQEEIQKQAQQEHLKSELSFLRSQISPHFIFNVLNSIVYLIRSKSDQAEAVTIKLSELMRYMLYNSADEQVPLDKEVDYLKNYIGLQKIRFEEDVEINLSIKGQVSTQQIEPMLLIPFVENAFKHGIDMLDKPVIDIELQFDEKELYFSVRNKVTPVLSSGDNNFRSGIGLPNVKRRLELLYPEKFKLDINKDETWFNVALTLPFSEEREKIGSHYYTYQNETQMHSS